MIDGWPVCVVVDHEGIVAGAVRSDAVGLAGGTRVAAVLQPGPPTVRPSITASELLASMEEGSLDHVLVTTYDGRLLGLITREELRAH